MTRPGARVTLGVLALAVVLAAAACGGEPAPAPDTTADSVALSQAPANPPSDVVPPNTSAPPIAGASDGADVERPGGAHPPVWSMDATRVQRDVTAAATLTAVRTAGHDGYDRMVFEFDGVVPGYAVEYVRPPVIACGSGDDVPLPAGVPLVVRFTPARAHDDAGGATVTDRDRTPALPVLHALRTICDFEAHLEWVATLSDRRPFTVTVLDSPARVIVDVRHR